MNIFKSILLTIILVPSSIFCQESNEYSKVNTNTGAVKIPGKWEQLNKIDDSGQTYLRNSDGVVLGIAKNLKKSYSFFKPNLTDFEHVKLFYKWDSDYYKENKFKIDKIKENQESEYIIWKYNDSKIDNVFLFGSAKNVFLNLLVYTDRWTEGEKVVFLENLFELNK